MCDKVSLLQQFISRQRFSCTAVHSAVIRYGRFPWRHIVKIKNFVIHCIHIPGSFPLKELLDAHEPFSAAWQAANISTFCACFQASDRLTEIPAPAAEMKAENFPQAVQAGKRTLQTASCPPASAFLFPGTSERHFLYFFSAPAKCRSPCSPVPETYQKPD